MAAGPTKPAADQMVLAVVSREAGWLRRLVRTARRGWLSASRGTSKLGRRSRGAAMTTQSHGEGSDEHDTGSRDEQPTAEEEVESRPDTAGYPSADDAGGPVAEAATPTDDRDHAGYPDAGDTSESN